MTQSFDPSHTTHQASHGDFALLAPCMQRLYLSTPQSPPRCLCSPCHPPFSLTALLALLCSKLCHISSRSLVTRYRLVSALRAFSFRSKKIAPPSYHFDICTLGFILIGSMYFQMSNYNSCFSINLKIGELSNVQFLSMYFQ